MEHDNDSIKIKSALGQERVDNLEEENMQLSGLVSDLAHTDPGHQLRRADRQVHFRGLIYAFLKHHKFLDYATLVAAAEAQNFDQDELELLRETFEQVKENLKNLSAE